MSPRKKSSLSVVLTSLVLCFRTSGSELEPPTAQAYEEYVKTAQARMQNEVNDPGHFLRIDGLPDAQKAAVISRLRSGELIIQPMTTTEHQNPLQIRSSESSLKCASLRILVQSLSFFDL
jgi:hypothetical protein